MTLYREITDEERRTWSATRFQCLNVVPIEEPIYVKNDCRHLALGHDTTEGARCFKCNASLRWVVEIGGDDE